MRDKKQKPTMLILFLVSFAIFTVLSFLGSRRAYRSYALELNIAREPALSMLFRGLHDGVFPWNNGEEREEPLNMEKAEESFFFHISDPAVEDQEVLTEEGADTAAGMPPDRIRSLRDRARAELSRSQITIILLFPLLRRSERPASRRRCPRPDRISSPCGTRRTSSPPARRARRRERPPPAPPTA